MNALDPILQRARSEVARRRRVTPMAEVERAASMRLAAGPRRPFAQALAGPGLSVIAEHKRRSPSAGVMRPSHPSIALEEVVSAYERGGATALSILTEEPSFGGTLADLGIAREASTLPILRKDFVVDAYQVPEALAAGADAILLIVAALGVGELESLYAQAGSLGLGVLVEVHDQDELAVAAELGARVIGINNRDLTTLEVDTATTHRLLPEIPPGSLVVAESGFRTRAELDRLVGDGVDAVLIGEALMRAPDIEAACRALTGSAEDR